MSTSLGFDWTAGLSLEVVGAIACYGEEKYQRDPEGVIARWYDEVVDDYVFRSNVRAHRTAADINFLLALGEDPVAYGHTLYQEGYELAI